MYMLIYISFISIAEKYGHSGELKGSFEFDVVNF